MPKATDKQLKDRWLTPKGGKIRKQIIDHIGKKNWERFLKGFDYVDEIKYMKDLRFIDFKRTYLRGID